jgi:predicted ArsR family transcriptional regulator
MAKLIVKSRFGVIPVEILNSKELSLSAKGLYGYLQSKPDGWKFSISRMASQLKEGKDAIRRAILELERFGLLKRVPKKDKNGRWAGYDYELSDKMSENQTISSEKLAEKPSTENPTTVNPTTDFSDTISKKDNSKKENSKIDIKLEATSDEVAEPVVNELISLFKYVNPTYNRLYANKTEREALKRLVKQFGKEKIAKLIKALPEIIVKPYAPRITTPYQLEKKLADLLAFIQQERSTKSKYQVGKV